MHKLTLDSTDYQMGYKSPDGNVLFTNEITVDTVTGDSASISINFDIYYQGIKQGSINPVFLIDRRNPFVPEVVSTTENNFSRDNVEVTFVSNEEVYYSISSPILSLMEQNNSYSKANNLSSALRMVSSISFNFGVVYRSAFARVCLRI